MAEIVYINHANPIELELQMDGVAQDLSSVTRMALDCNGTRLADSQTVSGVFDWDRGETGRVLISLGRAGLAAGSYTSVRLLVWDDTSSDPYVWGFLSIEVKA